jgi:regulatory protein
MFRRKRAQRQDKSEAEENSAKPLSAADAEKIRVRTLQRAVKLLAAKPRSVEELRERLLEKSWTNAQAVDAALAKLKEYDYLNDEQFARQFAAARVRQKPMGRTRVARDLKRKKVDRETAEAALEEVFNQTSEDALIDEAIARYTLARGRPQTQQETKRLADHLLRRGFSYDLIFDKVRAAAQRTDEDKD